jgi:RHS repeat-associated protein
MKQPLFHATENLVRDPAFPDRILACTNVFGTTAVTGFEYTYDLLGRPVLRNDDAFAYDTRGQVTNMVRGVHANHPQTNTYAYDLAGNRTAANASPFGAQTWTANALNQTTAIGNWPFLYDADGNLSGEEGEVFHWDAENRFVGITNEGFRMSNAYDWRSRRVRTEHGTQTTPQERRTLVYDGWNIVYDRMEEWYDAGWERYRDLDFFWGRDLSGTLQGAGGVGGLVAVSIDGQYYFPCYDNLGNVVAYVDEAGTKVASYTYDAFGQIVSSSGTMMRHVFPHRFSTKWYDGDAEMIDYGYRWYWPLLGKWLNRDPIGEEGGENLYGFCGNNGVFSIDVFGLSQLGNRSSGSLVDIKTGVRDFGVIVYFTHTTNFRYLNLGGNQGHRIAHFLTCHSKVLIDRLEDKKNVGDFPMSIGIVGTLPHDWHLKTREEQIQYLRNLRYKSGLSEFDDVEGIDDPEKINGGQGTTREAFLNYSFAVFTAAKKSAEGLCCPTGGSKNPHGNVVLKFYVHDAPENMGTYNILIKYQNDWKTRIGMLHSSTMTYNCISKKWTGSYATSKLFREEEK